MVDVQRGPCGPGWHMGWRAACLFSPAPLPSTCSPQLDWFPGPCLLGELEALFSHPPFPQTGLLIFKPAGAPERGCIIQKVWREKGRQGSEWEQGGVGEDEGEGEIQIPETPVKDSADWGGGGGGQRNIITKNSSRVLQAEPFRRLIIVPLQIWIYHQIIPCLFCKINVNKR